MPFEAVCIVDDSPCRTAILREFSQSQGLPVIDRAEAAALPAGHCAIFVHDAPGAITGVLAGLAAEISWQPVIGYRPGARPSQVVVAIRAGAIDFFDWPQPAEELAIRMADVAEEAVETGAARLRSLRAAALVATLSPREREVLIGLAGGHSNKGIGRALGISPRTVEIHRARMRSKLPTDNSVGAVRIAVEAGILNALPGTAQD